jgi:hypothetical protein
MRQSRLVTGTLRAVENGQVSVEQLLKAAMAYGDSFADWLESKLPRWPDRRVRHPTLYAPKKLPLPVARAAVRLARRRFSGRPGVISVHWGMVRQRDLYTSQTGVLVFVERKMPSDILPEPMNLPTTLDIKLKGRLYRVRVDVQAPGAQATRHALAAARPGNRATVSASEVGVLSAVVTSPDGTLRALLSGHVAGQQGAQVSATSFDGSTFDLGTVDVSKNNATDDLAATGAISTDAADFLTLTSVVVRDPDESDAGSSLFIYTTRGAPISTSITGVGAAPVLDGSKMTGLFTTPHLTTAGDSGSPALDSGGDLVGFVVGGDADNTYLIPARRAINELFA